MRDSVLNMGRPFKKEVYPDEPKELSRFCLLKTLAFLIRHMICSALFHRDNSMNAPCI
jgi:hypothetical protein